MNTVNTKTKKNIVFWGYLIGAPLLITLLAALIKDMIIFAAVVAVVAAIGIVAGDYSRTNNEKNS